MMKTVNNVKLMLMIFVSVLLMKDGFAQSGAQDISSIDRVGTTAAQFLKIGAGARPIGMGSAYTAVANDILSVYWNPAGLARVGGYGEAMFNHSAWLADTRYNFAAFSLNLSTFGALAFHVISFSTPEQPVRTIENPEGTGQNWDANSIALGLTYAQNLTDRFSIGFTARYIGERIFNANAMGMGFDIGIFYETPIENLTLGAVVSNFGTKMRMYGRDLYINHSPIDEDGTVEAVPAEYRTDSYHLPLNLKFGLAWNAVHNENFSVLVAADGRQANDNSPSVNTGLEIGVKNIVFIRAGYKSLFMEESEESFTFGAGLRYDVVGTNLKFDFGWADYGRLKNVQFISLAIGY
jgi:hypothetical protein